ncbi:excisionase family DNA binding protein [Agromyces terreus]|uniref:Excisionase family DNA binding protein n=1 Tax=Agromyces terreus TaxID=424795 RepID=A0A9X2GYE1_9MICO|nr:helix-turn-helix domain-containing protein [Agromyces terreus]MCP2371355.1 excisionase family DNA binding protein [Agromyces terreus]
MSTSEAGELGRFLSVADAAQILDVDSATIIGLIGTGELPALRVGDNGPWRIERTQLEFWIDFRLEEARRSALWQQGEFADVTDFSNVTALGPRRLLP